MYKLTKYNSVVRQPDNACIPFADGNSDYEQYKLWLAAGNTPLPADPIPNPAITAIDAQLISLEQKKIRLLTDIILGNGDIPDAYNVTSKTRLSTIEVEMQNLRNTRRTLPLTV